MTTTTTSPLHRDPDQDGDHYGCFTDEANAAVDRAVRTMEFDIRTGTIHDQDSFIDQMQWHLRNIGAGATDTVVRENVAQALSETLAGAGIGVEALAIHTW